MVGNSEMMEDGGNKGERGGRLAGLWLDAVLKDTKDDADGDCEGLDRGNSLD